MSDENKPLRILCPFCDAPYTATMMVEIDLATEAWSDSGYGQGAAGRSQIYCDNCKRLVYVKEFDTIPD